MNHGSFMNNVTEAVFRNGRRLIICVTHDKLLLVVGFGVEPVKWTRFTNTLDQCVGFWLKSAD